MSRTKAAALISLFLLFSAASEAELVEVSSGKRQVTLIELYTSEGCSSCPPADRWLSEFVEHRGLWKSVIPLSFHVDYWNYLGWDDRFSDPAFSARQRNHKRAGNLRAVYTPGTLVNGSEWRGLLEGFPLPPRANRYPGNLTLKLDKTQPGIAGLVFDADPSEELIAHFALIGTGLETQVRRGENGGKLLKHDFVVLSHQSQQGGGQWLFEYDPITEATAVAAWVSKGVNGKPIQAVASWYQTP